MISSRGRVWSRTGVGDRRRRASGSPSKMTSHRTRKPAVSREFLHEDRGSSRRRLAEDSRKTGPNAIRDDHLLGFAQVILGGQVESVIPWHPSPSRSTELLNLLSRGESV